MGTEPANVFCADAATLGPACLLEAGTRLYLYLSTVRHGWLVRAIEGGSNQPLLFGAGGGGAWVTDAGQLSAAEARDMLALPGPLPDRIVELHLPWPVDAYGPAWVRPRSPAAVADSPGDPRRGAGREWWLPAGLDIALCSPRIEAYGPAGEPPVWT